MAQPDAVAALRRWMAGNDTVKDLDNKSTIHQPELQLLPMWLVRARQNDQEQVFMEPAAAFSVSALKQLTIPAADLEPFDYETDTVAVEPTVPYDRMWQWLQDEQQIPESAVTEVSLVHLPIFICKYEFDGELYTAVVDAATSRVFANIFPTKWEVPYQTIGIGAFVAYFLLAWILPISFWTSDSSGLGVGILTYLILAAVVAVPLFIAAAVISAKV